MIQIGTFLGAKSAYNSQVLTGTISRGISIQGTTAPNKFTLVVTLRLPMTVTIINAPDKSLTVPLQEPVHIIPEENKLSGIFQTPVRPSIETPPKFCVNCPYIIHDDKPNPT